MRWLQATAGGAGWWLLLGCGGQADEHRFHATNEHPLGFFGGDPGAMPFEPVDASEWSGMAGMPSSDSMSPSENEGHTEGGSHGKKPEQVMAQAIEALELYCGNCHVIDSESSHPTLREIVDRVPLQDAEHAGVLWPGPDVVEQIVDWWEAPRHCLPSHTSLEQLNAKVFADREGLAADEREYARYLTFAHHLNAGACAHDLNQHREALSRFVNFASSADQAVVPVALDPQGSEYRIDLRQLGWDRPVTVNDTEYPTFWSALGASIGGWPVHIDDEPIALPADAVMARAAGGSMYLAGAAIPSRLPGGVRTPVAQEEGDTPWLRSVVVGDDGSQGPQVIEWRSGVGEWLSGVWAQFPLPAPGGPAFAGERELQVPDQEIKAILVARDGRLAFATYSAEGDLSEGVAASGLACLQCHARGIVGFQDTAWSTWQDRNGPPSAAAEAVFGRAGQMQSLAQEHTQAYTSTLIMAGVSTRIPDALTWAVRSFGEPLSFRQVAAELFVTEEQLEEQRPALPDELARLSAGDTVARAGFEEALGRAWCLLHGPSGASSTCD